MSVSRCLNDLARLLNEIVLLLELELLVESLILDPDSEIDSVLEVEQPPVETVYEEVFEHSNESIESDIESSLDSNRSWYDTDCLLGILNRVFFLAMNASSKDPRHRGIEYFEKMLTHDLIDDPGSSNLEQNVQVDHT